MVGCWYYYYDNFPPFDKLKFGINVEDPPEDGDPSLAVGDKACIGADNGVTTPHKYPKNAPALYVSGNVGIGPLNPYALQHGGYFTSTDVPRLDVRERDNVLPGLTPLISARGGFIGQSDEVGSASDPSFRSCEKFIIVGTSTRDFGDSDNSDMIESVPFDAENPKSQYALERYAKRRTNIKWRRFFASVKAVSGINLKNCYVPGKIPPEDRYGMSIRWGEDFSALQLVDVGDGNVNDRKDTVFSWGQRSDDLMRFRYVGPMSWITGSTTAIRGRDIVVIYPVGVMKVRGGIVSYKYGHVSDVRLKHSVEPIANAASKVLALRGVSFAWKCAQFPEENFCDGRQIGLIAQEVDAVCPELVSTDENGYKSVDYSKLTPLLIEAIKEQQASIQAQKSKIETLERRLKSLCDAMQSLETRNVTGDQTGG